MLRDDKHPTQGRNQQSAQARDAHDEGPCAAPIDDDTVIEALTALVLSIRVPPRARERALRWLESEIRREDDAPPSDVRPLRPR